MEIRLISLHHISEDGNFINKDINVNDGIKYVNNLISNIENSKEIREYKAISFTTEIVNMILNLCRNYKDYGEVAATKENISTTNKNITSDIFNRIAERLTQCQQNTQHRHKGMNKPQKGNLIQMFIEKDDTYDFIISLIDSKKFIDENDLKYKSGMLDGKENTLKGAKFSIDKNSFNFVKIVLSDNSRNNIPQYWYKDFLELDEARGDIKNTTTAYNTINTIIRNKLSKNFKADYQVLKNSLNTYFLHNDKFSYEICIDYLMENYEPVEKGWDKHEVKEKLVEANSRGIFDNIFNINNKDIKSKLINVKYTINNNVELKIKKPVEKMSDSMYTEKLLTGEYVLILRNVEDKILEEFNFNKIDLK